MLLLDDLLLGPLRGVLWVAEKVHEAAQEELAGEADAITEELRQLYLQLEGGRISEAEFDEREGLLLDRLDAVQADDEEDEDRGEEAGEEEAATADAKAGEAGSAEPSVDEEAVDPTAPAK